MKISIGMEDNKTLIEVSFFVYGRTEKITLLEIFNYPLYARVGDRIALFNGKIVFDCNKKDVK